MFDTRIRERLIWNIIIFLSFFKILLEIINLHLNVRNLYKHL